MNQSKITVRYAKALFLTSKEKGLLEKVYSDVFSLYEIFRTVKEINLLYNDPVIKTSQKIKITERVFSNSVNKLVFDFLKLIITNKRESHILDIIRNFIDLYKKEKNIKTAYLSTSGIVDQEIIKELTENIKKALNSEIELHHKTDEEIIGGFVLKIEGSQYDASVATRLKILKRELINTTFETKLPKIEN
ncbi:MAG TPA: ATP synthase F1 subunit delta [Bacteroidales bacterium]|nr:MAG: ATP synthase F1 subunit delta [Bacteroidetes bacterium GWF2_33_38]OFY73474.1 MAG: ATP synthase F1 subunit delta [Bacteroidetes bacterium RIFOXYA12_FULL_33_9]OFY89090.1 MAG: ATP synthase F1 subunit delta [Bacteroidetes bacterium RIFOXYA2_FULL_33_7]HBF88858.1 ATP synthase F1 subunit delta [Bacteroidales bacterium]